MNFAVVIVSAAAGAIAGWLVFELVNRYAPGTHRASLQKKLTVMAAATLIPALWVRNGDPRMLLIYGALMLVLVGVTLFDIRRHEIPHIVTLPGIVAGLLIGTFVLPLGFSQSIAGLLVGGGVLLAATVFEALRKKEIGGGDWKYAAMIGSFIGPQKIIVALLLTGIFGFIGAIALWATGNGGRPQALGPWLGAGAAASILFG